MHLKRILPALVGGAAPLVLLAACGSSGPTNQARDAVSTMAAALQTYNGETQTDVRSTARACQVARAKLQSNTWLDKPASDKPDRALITALSNAYHLAHTGFSDCAVAAPFNYTLMAQADAEISEANQWLTRARTLDQ